MEINICSLIPSRSCIIFELNTVLIIIKYTYVVFTLLHCLLSLFKIRFTDFIEENNPIAYTKFIFRL